MEYYNYILLFLFAFIAGFIDSSVGGGGLIQLPALLVFSPGSSVLMAMGINKFAALSGTLLSSARYIRQTEVPWKSILPAVVTALIFSFVGARVVFAINKDYFRIILIILLAAVALYIYFRKDFGIRHNPKLSSRKTLIYSLLTGTVIGFYDGFFGPGTGTFLIIIFISVFGFNFLTSSVSAKLINSATGIAALSYFIYTGNISYTLAIPVALFNMLGSFIGTRIAIRKGNPFIRALFLIVSGLMIIKLCMEYFN